MGKPFQLDGTTPTMTTGDRAYVKPAAPPAVVRKSHDDGVGADKAAKAAAVPDRGDRQGWDELRTPHVPMKLDG